MTDKPKGYANGGYVGRSNYSGFKEYHRDDFKPMTEEERERFSKAFQVFIATVQAEEEKKKQKDK